MDQRTRIGGALRAARERQGLSIEQVAAAAAVPLRYARLLEGERPETQGVSDELYLIPFFRRYAGALGLDAEDLLPEFLAEVQDPPPSPRPTHPTYRSPLALLWRPAAVVATVIVALVLGMRATPESPTFDDEQWARADAEEEHAAVAEGPVAEPADASPAAAIAGRPAERDVAPTANPPADPARQLRITAGEDSWLSIGVDDQPRESVLLHAGEERTWTAQDTFTLTLGNAGGVRVSLDGRELPSFGRSGQVVRNLRLPGTG